MTRAGVVAVAAATALLLTGCGDADGGAAQVPGVGEGGSSDTPEPEPEPDDDAANDGVDRPRIELPEGISGVYEGWESEDPTEQRVLSDARAAQNAVDLAIVEHEPQADYVGFYHAAEALVDTEEWIAGFVRNDLTITGTIRYVDPEVTPSGDDQALVAYCADESGAVASDVGTGEEQPDSASPYVAYRNTLQRDDRGVWVTVLVHTERGQCAG
ncbi:hypothetical protein [Streptomyces otsuchiensis]|uniref:hypothetical protein n=1 Tax=Streptomyces otsuchiensis TaxID=2681388 RepID=UPI00102FC499|nr:hypothetical protein [Streptomyces otsuchiensis]